MNKTAQTLYYGKTDCTRIEKLIEKKYPDLLPQESLPLIIEDTFDNLKFHINESMLASIIYVYDLVKEQDEESFNCYCTKVFAVMLKGIETIIENGKWCD